MQHAILKSRPETTYWFRVSWNRIDYACREANGSLKPVPPGTTRKKLYCSQCKATKCLFTGKKVRSAREQQRTEAEKQAKYAQAKARTRGQGLTTGSKPLVQSCWNCCELRIKLGGYVCRHEPEAKPVSMGKMVHRYAEECQGFSWRREVEIPPLNGVVTHDADYDPL